MKRRTLIVTACISMLSCFALAGCDSEVNDVVSGIEELGEVTIESYADLEALNGKYEALDAEQKEKVENYAVLEDANERMAEILYVEIKESIEKAVSLEASYFAQYYDMSGFTAAKDAAQSVVDKSDEASYHETLVNLESEIDSLDAFIETEKANSFSVQTNDGEHPFAVEESDMSYSIVLEPIAKRSSDYPYNISFFEGDTTDEPTDMHFHIGSDSVCAYAAKVSQVDTIWINVQDADGEMKKAFVNTELVLSESHNNWGEENDLYPLGKGSCYLFQSEKGLTLAVQDLVTGNGYNLYYFW